MQLVFEGLFLIDIIMNFVTIIEDEMGYEITEMEKICFNYMSGWFLIDMISSVPINTLGVLNLMRLDITGSFNM